MSRLSFKVWFSTRGMPRRSTSSPGMSQMTEGDDAFMTMLLGTSAGGSEVV